MRAKPFVVYSPIFRVLPGGISFGTGGLAIPRVVCKQRAGSASSAKTSPANSESGSSSSGEVAPKKISVSQQSFDKQVDHLEQLIATLAAERKYIPNERELSVASLRELLAELKTCNLNVMNATADFTTARIARDRIFDSPKTGLVDTALTVKTYIKSVLGPGSPEYAEFSALRFVKRKV